MGEHADLAFLDEPIADDLGTAAVAQAAAPGTAIEVTPAAAPASPPAEVVIPTTLLVPTSFLCGPAGTGKTYLSRAWAKQHKGTVLAATTGIASVNLGEGTTINALLGYFDTASLNDLYISGGLTARLGKLWRAGLRRILLDEVSMLDGNQLTLITRALEELAGRGYVLDAQLQDELEEAAPDDLSPVALTVVGDFAQLPPVKAPFAFESVEWAKYAAHTHTLTEVRRQADRDFIVALQAARRGDAATVIEFFRSRLQTTTQAEFPGVTLFGRNDEVDRFNALRLDKLPGDAFVIESARWGTERGDWKNIPTQVRLKVGALVMLLANERDAGRGDADEQLLKRPLKYANGDLATIAAVDGERGVIYVTLQRDGKTHELQWVTRQHLVPLEPGRKKALRAEGNMHLISEDGRYEVVGEVCYLPIRVAYASTVHKSQGLSLDHVQVNTREHMFKTPGMLYVAMSRARTATGLRLVGTIDGLRERCTVHAKITEWL